MKFLASTAAIGLLLIASPVLGVGLVLLLVEWFG